jgi:hypothetical protein
MPAAMMEFEQKLPARASGFASRPFRLGGSRRHHPGLLAGINFRFLRWYASAALGNWAWWNLPARRQGYRSLAMLSG